ncbi:hypothetical protein T484DRAFT_1657510 [Baffinella frigidus]|nr:hypothetical protein T484DRAFT_1657510 [Cryptophyta sp. CCMP2293]
MRSGRGLGRFFPARMGGFARPPLTRKGWKWWRGDHHLASRGCGGSFAGCGPHEGCPTRLISRWLDASGDRKNFLLKEVVEALQRRARGGGTGRGASASSTAPPAAGRSHTRPTTLHTCAPILATAPTRAPSASRPSRRPATWRSTCAPTPASAPTPAPPAARPSRCPTA